MASTFSQIKTALDEIAQRINNNRNRLNQAGAAITTAESDLDAMTATYSTIISDLTTAATNNPNDAAIKAAKAEADLLVAEFAALKSTATAKKNAFNGA